MTLPLNLARRPFRNERLPTLLLAAGCVVLLGVTVRHAFLGRDLLPERTSAIDGELVALEQELAGLRQESTVLAGRDVSLATLEEWAAVRRLVDSRTFSWSALLGSLEEVTPPDVRLLSIAPRRDAGRLEVNLRATGRTVEAGLRFLNALQERDEFQGPFLDRVDEKESEVEFEFTVGYSPAPLEAGEAS